MKPRTIRTAEDQMFSFLMRRSLDVRGEALEMAEGRVIGKGVEDSFRREADADAIISEAIVMEGFGLDRY